MITAEIQKYVNKSVLCWLATASKDGFPNVSPKEIFTYYKDDTIIIANIASPQSIKNIKENNKVCVSFIDVLVQKGYQLKGSASLIDSNHKLFEDLSQPLIAMTGGKFPFKTIIQIHIEKVKPIVAPKYVFYPETSEEEQIKSALSTYRISIEN